MASKAGYKHCRSSPVLNPSSYLQEPRDIVVDDCHMLEPQVLNPRKRQRSEQRLPQLNGTSQPLLERGKLNHTHRKARSRTPAAFYDNLSKVWLTKRALRELDRRNAQLAPSSSCSSPRRPRRPFTRRTLVELRKNGQFSQSASDFLCHCEAKCLKDIKRLARQGGPDLLDLRGVCIAKYLLVSELTISL